VGTYNNDGKNFLDVLKSLEKIENLARIRVSSIEPTTIGKDVIDFMSQSQKICPYLHIPLQSGDDEILSSMRRKHDSAFYRDIIEYAVEKIPGIGIGTDIMVGYPGEGQDQYKNSKTLLADLPISFFHVFTYSDRKGTTSYKMKEKVDHREKKQRYSEIVEMGQRKKNTFYERFLNQQLNVLFEEEKHGSWSGFTGNYIRVNVKSNKNLHNEVHRVKLLDVQNEGMIGELV